MYEPSSCNTAVSSINSIRNVSNQQTLNMLYQPHQRSGGIFLPTSAFFGGLRVLALL